MKAAPSMRSLTSRERERKKKETSRIRNKFVEARRCSGYSPTQTCQRRTAILLVASGYRTLGCLPFEEKSGWCNCWIMVRDFPKIARLRLPFFYQALHPARPSRKSPGNGGFIQMVRNFPSFRSEWKKRSPLKVLRNFPTEFPENDLTI